MAVSIEAKRGGIHGHGGGMGGGGGDIVQVPNSNYNGNYDSGNYGMPVVSDGNYGGNYEPVPTTTTTTNTLPHGSYDTSDTLVQLTSTDYNETNPSWSPDGAEIAYLKDDIVDYPPPGHLRPPYRTMWKMTSDGASEARLSNRLGWVLEWSPDSAEIAFDSPSTNCPAEGSLWKMSSDGTGVTELSASDCNNDYVPRWSPGGTKIAYTTEINGWFRIRTMNSDGAGKAELTSPQSGSPEWSPDGTKITYRDSGAGNLWVMDPDGSNKKQLTSSGKDYGQIWTPDGSKIVFVSRRTGNSEIWIMNSDGSGQTPLTSDNSEDLYPQVSPDGTKMAFESNRAGNWDIWVMDLDGSNQEQLTTDAAEDRSPEWAPDGTKLAFHSDRSGNFDIWVYNFIDEGRHMCGGKCDPADNWWDTKYQYRQQITIENNAGSVMESGYTVDVDISPLASKTQVNVGSQLLVSCSASTTYGGGGPWDCTTLFDGLIQDGWAATDNQDTAWVEFSLTESRYVDALKIYNKESPWRISSYTFDYWDDSSGSWKRILDSTSIGYGETILSELPRTRASRFRLDMNCNRESTSSCQLKELELYSTVIDSEKMLPTGDDIRVVYFDETNNVELDRLLDIDGGTVTFATQADIAAGGSDSDYYAYYGNPDADAPMDNADNIFLFYDDFSVKDLSKWGTRLQWGATWDIVDGVSILDGQAELYSLERFSPPVVLEFNHAFQWENIGGDHKLFGFMEFPLTTYRLYGASWGQNDHPNYIVTTTGDGSGNYGGAVTDWTPEILTTKTLIWDTDTPEFRWYENGVEGLNSPVTTHIPTKPLQVVLNIDAPGFQKMDWVLVRKYLSPEPTTSRGGEETKVCKQQHMGGGKYDTDDDGVPDARKIIALLR